MQKLIEKDKHLRLRIKTLETKCFVLKSIIKNLNFFSLIRWNAFLQLVNLSKLSSKISTVNRCFSSVNKKRFNKLTGFSRHVFLKNIRNGSVNGVKKSSW